MSRHSPKQMQRTKEIAASAALVNPYANLVRKLCAGIMREAIEKGWADINDPQWNPQAHVELTLTVADIRIAAKLVGYTATAKELEVSDRAREWDEYLEELDGVE